MPAPTAIVVTVLFMIRFSLKSRCLCCRHSSDYRDLREKPGEPKNSAILIGGVGETRTRKTAVKFVSASAAL
jgi:hypothetical protein